MIQVLENDGARIVSVPGYPWVRFTSSIEAKETEMLCGQKKTSTPRFIHLPVVFIPFWKTVGAHVASKAVCGTHIILY